MGAFPQGEESLALAEQVSRHLEQVQGKQARSQLGEETLPGRKNSRENNRVPHDQKSASCCLGYQGFTRAPLSNFLAM